MSDEQVPAWAKAMEERLIGCSDRLTTQIDRMEHRLTGKIIKLITDSEERIARRLDRLFPKPPD